MTLKEFLDKETPKEGGCMLVLVPKKYGTPVYLLVERHMLRDVELFKINDRPYYEYGFLWDENTWRIIFKSNH